MLMVVWVVSLLSSSLGVVSIGDSKVAVNIGQIYPTLVNYMQRQRHLIFH